MSRYTTYVGLSLIEGRYLVPCSFGKKLNISQIYLYKNYESSMTYLEMTRLALCPS